MVSKNINSRLILTNGKPEKWDKLTLGASEESIDDVVGIVDFLGSSDVLSDSFFEDVSCAAFGDTEAWVSTWSCLI